MALKSGKIYSRLFSQFFEKRQIILHFLALLLKQKKLRFIQVLNGRQKQIIYPFFLQFSTGSKKPSFRPVKKHQKNRSMYLVPRVQTLKKKLKIILCTWY
jgi:hypothetical protein